MDIMSITTPYVRADDGLYYKDPTIRGMFRDRRWFICFDELVVESVEGETPAAFTTFALNLLRSVGISASGVIVKNCSGRNHDGVVIYSRCADLRIESWPAGLFQAAGYVGEKL